MVYKPVTQADCDAANAAIQKTAEALDQKYPTLDPEIRRFIIRSVHLSYGHYSVMEFIDYISEGKIAA